MVLKRKQQVEDDEDDYRSRARTGKKQKEERGKYKLSVGENTFRILKTPANKELNSPSVFMYYRLHRDVGPKNGYARCGKDIDGDGECWLCDVQIPHLRKKGKTKSAAKLEPDGIFVCQVAAYDGDTEEWRGPLTYTTGQGSSAKSMAYKMENLIQSTKRDFVSHKGGYNVTVERTGTGKNDTHYGDPMADDEPSDVPKGIVAKLKPFEEILQQYDEERQKAVYFGRDQEEDEEEEKSMPKKPKKPAREEEEEQEESAEEETEAEEEEEEEEPPKKPKKPVKKPKVEEEEEEESEEETEAEEESEEEEEEAPPKKSVKKPKKPAPDEEEEEIEEEGESEEEEEEEEEEPPKKLKKPVKKPKVEEEESEEEASEEESESEEEEEPVEEEEEEEPPKKPKKKPGKR